MVSIPQNHALRITGLLVQLPEQWLCYIVRVALKEPRNTQNLKNTCKRNIEILVKFGFKPIHSVLD
jgi:hypothetical protein